MAEDQSHDDDELNIATAEKGSPDVSNTEEDEGGDSAAKQKNDGSSEKGEENKESLDLEEEEDTASPQEKKRQEQENAWFGKIVSGQKTLDDLPKHQQWLRKPLEERLKAQNKTQEVAKEYDIDAIVEQKLNEKEDIQTFKVMESTLAEMSLDAAQVADLRAEFKENRKYGLPRSVALKKAVKACGIKLETDMRRQYMASPKAGDRDHQKETSDIREKYQKGDPRRVKALAAEAQQFGQG